MKEEPHKPLPDLEKLVSRDMLNRGADLLERGSIISLDLSSQNAYQSKVKGTEEYTVDIVLDDNFRLFTHLCSCPYKGGPICKHKIATMLLIRSQLEST